MNKLVHLIFYVSFLFWGGGFLIAFGQYVAYNGLGNLFSYVLAEDAMIEYETEYLNKIELTIIDYRYEVDQKDYSKRISIASKAIEEDHTKIDEVYYNTSFPSLSYVGDNGLELRKASVGMTVAGIGFAFFLSIFLFADLEKWIGVYTRGEFKSSKKS